MTQQKDFAEKYWRKTKQGLVFRHISALSLVKKGKVLDLGCGDGFFLKCLKEKDIDGEGLDISQTAVEKAKEKGVKADVFDFSKNPLPFADNSFATVVLLDVLEHIFSSGFVLKEAARVGEEVIIAVPNFNSLPSRLQMILGMVPENNRAKQGHIFWFNYRILRRLLREAGLEIVCLKTNSFFNHFLLFKQFTLLMTKIWPSCFALTFTVKARKIENSIF